MFFYYFVRIKVDIRRQSDYDRYEKVYDEDYNDDDYDRRERVYDEDYDDNDYDQSEKVYDKNCDDNYDKYEKQQKQ